MNDEVWVVLSTFADENEAARVARALVEDALVACAQIETRPIRSIYRWKNAIEDDAEILLRLKTTGDARDRMVARLVELHPYDVPQVVAWPARATADYAKWVREQCDS